MTNYKEKAREFWLKEAQQHKANELWDDAATAYEALARIDEAQPMTNKKYLQELQHSLPFERFCQLALKELWDNIKIDYDIPKEPNLLRQPKFCRLTATVPVNDSLRHLSMSYQIDNSLHGGIPLRFLQLYIDKLIMGNDQKRLLRLSQLAFEVLEGTKEGRAEKKDD